MWGLVTGIVSYPVFAWAGHRWLDDQGLPAGLTRATLVFLAATALSSGLGYGVSWLSHDGSNGPSASAKLQDQTTALLKQEVECFRSPSTASCQSAVRQGNQLLRGLGGG